MANFGDELRLPQSDVDRTRSDGIIHEYGNSRRFPVTVAVVV